MRTDVRPAPFAERGSLPAPIWPDDDARRCGTAVGLALSPCIRNAHSTRAVERSEERRVGKEGQLASMRSQKQPWKPAVAGNTLRNRCLRSQNPPWKPAVAGNPLCIQCLPTYG